MGKNRLSLITDQFSAVKEKYPGLGLIHGDGRPLIQGPLDFRANYGDKTITSVFNIEIHFQEDYPDSPPIAREVGGCIPPDFHKHQYDILCLSAPVVIKIRFSRNPTILSFIEETVIPYLYSFRYWEKYGEMPYGEYSHGFKGIIQSYRDLFNNKNDMVVMMLLRILAEDNYRGHLPCPCNSGKKLRHCHGYILIEAKNGTGKDSFFYDFIAYLAHYHKKKGKIPRGMISKRIAKPLNKFIKKEGESIK